MTIFDSVLVPKLGHRRNGLWKVWEQDTHVRTHTLAESPAHLSLLKQTNVMHRWWHACMLFVSMCVHGGGGDIGWQQSWLSVEACWGWRGWRGEEAKVRGRRNLSVWKRQTRRNNVKNDHTALQTTGWAFTVHWINSSNICRKSWHTTEKHKSKFIIYCPQLIFTQQLSIVNALNRLKTKQKKEQHQADFL